MKLKCTEASASEAGDEIFQVMFEADPDQEDRPYVLIQRAWLEEDDEDETSTFYVETHGEDLIGHYETLNAELTRDRLILQLPPPTNETIEVEFTTSDDNFREIQRVLGIILQRDLGKEAEDSFD